MTNTKKQEFEIRTTEGYICTVQDLKSAQAIQDICLNEVEKLTVQILIVGSKKPLSSKVRIGQTIITQSV